MLSKQFITAGSAIFTIELPADRPEECQPHYTFLVQHVEGKNGWTDTWFVKLLTGPGNASDYTYVGILDVDTGVVRTTKKSPYNDNTYCVRLLNRVLYHVWRDSDVFVEHGYALHHEGRCGRCGRTLTVPESVESGIGPVCARSVLGQ